MRLRYIIIIILVIIITIVVALFLMSKKEVKKVTNIKTLEFFYTTGNMMNADVYYKLECNKNCKLTVSKEGENKEDAKIFDVDKSLLSKVEKILNDNKVTSWNGFNKSDNNVLDGNSFSMHISFNDSYISASGYMMYPNNYRIVKEKLDELFMDIYNNNQDVDYKPIIYLYPESIIDVSVKLGNPDKLFVSYPNYDNSWEVIAYPNSDLIDKKTNRKLYSLFWEGINTVSSGIKDEGFVVAGNDITTFLEEKLEILGLNEREIEEFIIYWLPKLKNNKYNYIRFETLEEQNINMPLIIEPTPDTVIRVNMEYKALDNKIKVRDQKLKTPKREGFTVVEWGGTEL